MCMCVCVLARSHACVCVFVRVFVYARTCACLFFLGVMLSLLCASVASSGVLALVVHASVDWRYRARVNPARSPYLRSPRVWQCLFYSCMLLTQLLNFGNIINPMLLLCAYRPEWHPCTRRRCCPWRRWQRSTTFSVV